ncbi:coagulation factor II (thrombin) receptor-like 1, tandem duplicate 1 [Epinephelus fuscoguttatus]|uniref:coagulation factor II (thrombin) receptor-like 1, tandem duplicate 1 n=1 Tax=Epinephelus fuscoguttatus TaxID=293821 RepID=UPI0020D03EE6|nr:coagulation factor II (thrombin) receptor-like 1, tandem duplicate 1 [Epinephelus fuscoguttatus]
MKRACQFNIDTEEHSHTRGHYCILLSAVMTLKTPWVHLFLFLCCLQSCLCEQDSRGFPSTETNDGVLISSQAKRFLRSHLSTVFLPIIYIIVFVVALPTNAMAIWVFLFRTKKKHPSSIYMANLALADLLFVIWIPLKIAYHLNGNNWIYGQGLCEVLVAFFYGNMYCSISFIACISVQRYWAVVQPLSQRHRSNRLAVIVSITIWVVVWLLTIPLFLYEQDVRVRELNIITCHDVTKPSQKKIAAGYFLTMGIVGFVAPTIVCIISYVLMLKALRNNMEGPTNAKRRQKAVVLIITVLVMFLVCFTPSNIMLLVHYILLLGDATNTLYGFYITTLCLASLNSCFDPFIYYFISEDFRNHVKNTLRCRSERTVERMRVSFSALKFSKKSSTYTSDSGNTQSTEC